MDFPPVSSLVPHARSMLLLSSVVAHSFEETTCEVRTGDSKLFADAAGRVPAWVGLEYMAQAVAAHGGMLALAAGEGPRQGMLLGTRRMRMQVSHFEPGCVLRVSARHVHASEQMLSFECEIHDESAARQLAAARLSVFVAERIGTPRDT